MPAKAAPFERTVLQALREQIPVRDLPGVRIRAIREQPEERFDIKFELESGKSRVLVLGEIKSALSPKLLQQIAPWIGRMKSLRPGVAFVLICPALSLQAQTYCIENRIDFMDLAGNISINVPGTFTLQRLGRRSKEWNVAPSLLPATNVFSGRSSRVLRVLLENPKPWTATAIANELRAETKKFARAFSADQTQFAITPSAISKALSSLDEQLWIRRQGFSILLPEPRRLLAEWAEKYKDRYRRRLRSSFEVSNPLGATPADINEALKSLIRGPYAVTGATAALDAPFLDLDRIDVFLLPNQNETKLRQLDQRPGTGPKLRFIYPYDVGVFLYSRNDGPVPRVSNIQAYLDLYARGGRDLKQADYLLDNAIEPRWKAA